MLLFVSVCGRGVRTSYVHTVRTSTVHSDFSNTVHELSEAESTKRLEQHLVLLLVLLITSTTLLVLLLTFHYLCCSSATLIAVLHVVPNTLTDREENLLGVDDFDRRQIRLGRYPRAVTPSRTAFCNCSPLCGRKNEGY